MGTGLLPENPNSWSVLSDSVAHVHSGIFATDAKTQVRTQAGNAIPYLWNIHRSRDTQLAVFLGVTAALRRGWADRVIQIGAVVAQAVPTSLGALFLVLVFAINLELFRATGDVQPATNVGLWLNSITPFRSPLCASAALRASHNRSEDRSSTPCGRTTWDAACA